MMYFSCIVLATTIHVPYRDARVQGNVVFYVQKENRWPLERLALCVLGNKGLAPSLG